MVENYGLNVNDMKFIRQKLNDNMQDAVPLELTAARNKPLLYNLIGVYRNAQKETQRYKINKELPQIILPNNKIDMILNWWNETIRFEKTLPKAFKSGYIVIDYAFNDVTQELNRKFCRELAQIYNTSVYTIKDLFQQFIHTKLKIYIYFDFVSDTKVFFTVYSDDNGLLCRMWKGTFIVGESNEEMPITDSDVKSIIQILCKVDVKNNNQELLEHYYTECGRYYVAILCTILWYIATNTSNTKYVYTETRPKHNYEIKHVVNPKDVKTITSTIYDLRKTKVVNIEKLNKRKEGWTYSHAFQVHGHYRHYRNGKVIFIDSFIKGKEKPLKAQKIILDPKNEVIGGD